MNTNKTLKTLVLFFVIIFSIQVVSALSLIAEYEDGETYAEIMPGDSIEYIVMVVADQDLEYMIVKAEFYDVTTGTTQYLKELFEETTYELFYFPEPFLIVPADYNNLPGTYEIKVTAEEWLTNGYHTSKVKYLELEVIGNRLPVADFVYAPANPTTITPVTFTSTSYDEDGQIIKAEWFIDGVKIGEGNSIEHTFPAAGTYSVMLKVTDNEQGTGTKTKTVVVTSGGPTGYPVADFIYSPANPETNELITFTSTSYDVNGGQITNEEWDFNNDGVYEVQGHVAYKMFLQPGTYPVTLRVTDNSQLQSIKTKQIVVTVPGNIPPVAQFSYVPANPVVNQPVTFTSTSYDPDGWLTSQEWYIDGILAGSGNTLVKTFTQPGTYMVSLVVEDNDQAQDVETKQIVITQVQNIPPVAQFNYVPLNPVVGQQVTFTSTSFDPDGFLISQEWFINGVFAGQGVTLVKTFAQPGNYVVKLTVTDDDQATDSEIKNVVINQAPNLPPVAQFTFTPTNPQVGQQVTFTSTSFDPDGVIVSQLWFIDGVYAGQGTTLIKTFTQPGTYSVLLHVEDDDQATDSEADHVVVTQAPNLPPVADFFHAPQYPIEDELVTFTSTSYDPDGTIVSEEWFIDGQAMADVQIFTHNFTSPGTYEIKLRVMDNDQAFSEKIALLKINESSGGQNGSVVLKELGCNPDVVRGDIQHCAAKVDDNLKDVKIIFKYTHNDQTLGECYTNFKGYCHINPEINEPEGVYEVYALAYKEGVGYDYTKELRTSFRVWEQRYEIKNLKVFEDEFFKEKYTYNRSEDMYVSFEVYDQITHEYLEQGSGLFEHVFLRVNNEAPINMTALLNQNQNTFIGTFSKKIGKTLGKITGLSSTTFKYKLNYVPITDDLLGEGKVFVFVSGPDLKAGEGWRDVTVLNNPVIFNPPAQVVLTAPINMDMKLYLEDVETPKSEIKITWQSVQSTKVKVEALGNNVFKITPLTGFTGNVTIQFFADDTDGSIKQKGIMFVKENPCAPNAVLKMPESFTVGSTIKMDGSLSTPGCNASIIKYEWKIYKENTLVQSYTTTTPYQSHTFNSRGEYRVILRILTSKNLSDTDEKIVFAGSVKQGIVIGKEDKLFVDDFGVYGPEHGTISCEELFTVYATVSNDRNKDIKDMKITFVIPELGFELESELFKLDAGDTKTVEITGYLDMMKEEVPPGEYIALIGASDTDTVRSKYFPLIIK